jgi:cytochrome P450
LFHLENIGKPQTHHEISRLFKFQQLAWKLHVHINRYINVKIIVRSLLSHHYLSGAQWKNRRRLVTPGFHFQNHTSFIEIFNEKSADCAKEFEKTIDTHGNAEIDVTTLMAKCALNIICGKCQS